MTIDKLSLRRVSCIRTRLENLWINEQITLRSRLKSFFNICYGLQI
jgi:hypothetical protein